MLIDSRAGPDDDPPRDLACYAQLRLAELRVDEVGEFWGMFVERNQHLPTGLVLPLEVWRSPGACS